MTSSYQLGLLLYHMGMLHKASFVVFMNDRRTQFRPTHDLSLSEDDTMLWEP